MKKLLPMLIVSAFAACAVTAHAADAAAPAASAPAKKDHAKKDKKHHEHAKKADKTASAPK